MTSQADSRLLSSGSSNQLDELTTTAVTLSGFQMAKRCTNCAPPENTFTPEALALIVRSGEGLLRRTRNLALSSLIEAVRDQTRIVDLKQVNRVLIQPHWRKDCDNPLPSTPL